MLAWPSQALLSQTIEAQDGPIDPGDETSDGFLHVPGDNLVGIYMATHSHLLTWLAFTAGIDPTGTRTLPITERR